MPDGSPDDFLTFAHALADAAAVVQKRYFRTPVGVETKADESPVTIADREAEAAMRALIQERFPDHGVHGEEFGAADTGAEHVWVLDPIDGTKSFITGRPLFGTLIALLHHGKPILGICDHAILGERWVGRAGEATTWNGQAVASRSCAALAKGVMFCASPRVFTTPGEKAAYRDFEAEARLTMYSSDCYGYCLVASGFADIVCEAGLGAYDYMALVPILAGAGGLLTDWRGHALTLTSSGQVLAAGDPALHARLIARLAASSED